MFDKVISESKTGKLKDTFINAVGKADNSQKEKDKKKWIIGTSTDISKLGKYRYVKILINSAVMDVDDSFHLPLPPLARLYQTEPATIPLFYLYCIYIVCVFFRGSI